MRTLIGGGKGNCLGFAPRSESSVFKPNGLVTPFLRYPNLCSYANPLNPCLENEKPLTVPFYRKLYVKQ